MVIGNERMVVNMMGWWRKGVRKLGLMIELERESRGSKHEWNMEYEYAREGKRKRIENSRITISE